MWFVKFVIICLAIYGFGYLFFRVILPWMLKRFVKRFAKKMNPEFEKREKEEKAKKKMKEGDIKIDFVPEKKEDQSSTPTVDYVDYEELKKD